MSDSKERRIKVVDVPENATAQETEDLLNAPYSEGFYLDKLIFTWPGVACRAFYKLRVKQEN